MESGLGQGGGQAGIHRFHADCWREDCRLGHSSARGGWECAGLATGIPCGTRVSGKGGGIDGEYGCGGSSCDGGGGKGEAAVCGFQFFGTWVWIVPGGSAIAG